MIEFGQCYQSSKSVVCYNTVSVRILNLTSMDMSHTLAFKNLSFYVDI